MRSGIIRAIATGLLSLSICVCAGWATTMQPIERVCPIGGETYKSFMITSTSSFGFRLDLQRLGPQAYLPYVECPNGFLVFKDENEFTTDEIAKLTPVVTSETYQALRRDDVPAMRMVMLLHALGKTDVDLRYWYFKAAFESEGRQDEPLRRKHLAQAVDAYGDFLRGHAEHDEEWWFSSVRRADLLRQLGRFDKAIAAVAELEKAHGTENPIFPRVAAEIRSKAEARDSQPARYENPSE